MHFLHQAFRESPQPGRTQGQDVHRNVGGTHSSSQRSGEVHGQRRNLSTHHHAHNNQHRPPAAQVQLTEEGDAPLLGNCRKVQVPHRQVTQGGGLFSLQLPQKRPHWA